MTERIPDADSHLRPHSLGPFLSGNCCRAGAASRECSRLARKVQSPFSYLLELHPTERETVSLLLRIRVIDGQTTYFVPQIVVCQSLRLAPVRGQTMADGADGISDVACLRSNLSFNSPAAVVPQMVIDSSSMPRAAHNAMGHCCVPAQP
jgi:hypothetical protein